MTASALGDGDVARYLRDHPEFFGSHPELLSSITVPHHHGGRAISLHERQVEVLREKNRTIERRLADLIRVGEENDAIVERLQKWTRSMLVVSDPAALPSLVVDGMSAGFAVPQVALRLWGVSEAWRDLPCAVPVVTEAIALANSLARPYCGPNADLPAATWLPEGGAATRSIALLALRKGADSQAFGLLVLGSADAERFQSNMGTAFLERIAEIASAALSRLVE